jgi:hypothetical protein
VQHVPQCRRRQAADGELGGAIQKLAPADAAVNVVVEKTEQLRIEITGFFFFPLNCLLYFF